MIFRVVPKGDGFLLTVEGDEGEIILSLPAATLTEANALRRRGVIEGLDAVAAVRPEVKTKKKAS